MVKFRYAPRKLKPEVVRKRATKFRVSRVTTFIDPFPNILGTLPEKIVYKELWDRGIDASYRSPFLVNIPDAEIFKYYTPDFVLPNEKIIIEVQGSYWHSSAQAVEDDSFKQALYTLMGYKVLAWWDYEIESNVDLLFAREPSLAFRKVGSNIYTQDAAHDDLKGLRTLNRNRKKPLSYKSVEYKSSAKRKKASKTAIYVGRI